MPKKTPPPKISPHPKKRPALMPIKPKKVAKPEHQRAVARRARIKAILARTAKSRAELDQIAKGADISDLAHLPVIRPSGRRRVAFRERGGRTEPRVDLTEPAYRKAWGESLLPERTRPCPNRGCTLVEHPGVSCSEMKAWLRTSKRVLSGELVSPEDWPTINPADVIARKKRGRPPKDKYDDDDDGRRDQPGSLFKTARAATSCPAPNPSP